MKIEFIPSDENAQYIIPSPKPAKNYIPKWYKNLPSQGNASVEFAPDHTLERNVKKCLPFFDAMTAGYIQEAWCDIHFRVNEFNEFEYNTSSDIEIIRIRNKTSVEIPDKFYPLEFTWVVPWIPKTPKGWSILITDPLNSLDRPFVTTSGLVDSDNFFHAPNGSAPFYIYKNFNGFIEKGTPLFQMIPIKRESWNSDLKEYDRIEVKKREYFLKTKFQNIYRKNFWQKKEYQ
jgi:hypothetical protein